MRALILILVAAFVILVVWVALANAAQDVTLSFGFGWRGTASLAEVVFGAVFAGVLFTGLLALIEGLSLRLENRRLRRRVRQLDEEIHDLRNIGLRGRSTPGPAPSGGRVIQAIAGPSDADDET